MRNLFFLLMIIVLAGCKKTEQVEAQPDIDSNEPAVTENPAPETPAEQPTDIFWQAIAEPQDSHLKEKKSLWATYYKIHIAEHDPEGIPIIGKENEPLGISLGDRDWCEAALEGTVGIQQDGKIIIYNYMDAKGPVQNDCKRYYSSLKANVLKGMSKTRFLPSSAAYGYGVKGWHLVPFRTIAVDKTVIPYGTVIYIPKAKGVEVELPSGSKVIHDGYFYAGDTGGAIKQQHIDVFSGFYQKNPFPEIVKSSEDQTFEAYIIENADVKTVLDSLHQNQ